MCKRKRQMEILSYSNFKNNIKMAKMLKSKFAKNVRNIGENSIL